LISIVSEHEVEKKGCLGHFRTNYYMASILTLFSDFNYCGTKDNQAVVLHAGNEEAPFEMRQDDFIKLTVPKLRS